MRSVDASHPPSPLAEFLLSTHALLDNAANAKMVIKKRKPGAFAFELVPISLCQGLMALVGWHTPCEASIKNLKELIGHKRLMRIFLKEELQLNPAQLWQNQVALTKHVVHRIFIGLGDIRLEDLQERAAMEGKVLNNLSVKEIDRLYHKLMPAHPFEKALMSHCKQVNYHDKVVTHGKGFSGLQERVWTVFTAKSEVFSPMHTSPTHARMAEIEMLTSRFADREPPVGTVLRLKEGYFAIDRIFAQGGAHVSVLKEISASQPRILLLCRGTAASWHATGGYLSALNDCLKEIGSLGVKSIWADLEQYLREHKILQIDILGKSLGGAHAQYLTTLIGGATNVQVNSLVTNCSVGIPQKVQELFTQTISDKGLKEPEVLIVRNAGNPQAHEVDHVPCVGGVHLHTQKSTKVYYFLPHEDTTTFATPAEGSTMQKMLGLIHSFGFSHSRQNSLSRFSLRVGDNLAQEVKMGTHLEPVRDMMSTLFHYMTLGLVNGETFEKFYRRTVAAPSAA